MDGRVKLSLIRLPEQKAKLKIRKTKIVLIVASAAIILALIIFVGANIKLGASVGEKLNIQGTSVPFYTPAEIRNPNSGVDGYFEVSVAEGTPATFLINKGEQRNVTLLISFVSHKPKITEAVINVDPEGGHGLGIEQYYVLVNEKGDVYGRGKVDVNKLVTYEPNGKILIKAGQTIPLTLTIKIPTDFPSLIDGFPLGAIGIDTGHYPLISDVRVMVYA
jgi:hypothetical protein